MSKTMADKQRRGEPPAGKKAAEKRHQDEKLDEALEESFPASDPVDLTPHKKEPKADERKAPHAGHKGRRRAQHER
jgi:hypothetical protein